MIFKIDEITIVADRRRIDEAKVRHEFLLIATRGSCKPDASKLFDSVVSVERSAKHSEKPEVFREMIETLYTQGNKIELFARKPVEGWETWGNQS